MNNTDILVKNIVDYLKINKQNQSDLARFLGVPRQTVSRILKKQRDINAYELASIAEYLHVKVGDLYKFDNLKLEKHKFYIMEVK